MQELQSFAHNVYAVPARGGKMHTSVEVIIITSQPGYRLSNDDQTVRVREVQTHRFCATPDGLRQLAARLIKTADDAEAEVAALVKPECLEPSKLT